MYVSTYVIAWMGKSDSFIINDGEHISAVNIHQRDVVTAETVAAWCWVK